ncbi:MAG: hypothetical protein ACHQJ5_04580, partial [Vicinamibacteria bacterium]
MPVSVQAQQAGIARLERGGLTVEVTLDPLSIAVRRAGRPLVDGLTLFTQEGAGRDRLIELTEGVLVEETREPRREVGPATVVDAAAGVLRLETETAAGQASLLLALPARDRIELELSPQLVPFRLGATWPAGEAERLTGLGARHGEPFDQRDRLVRLGADRRYTGPDCPPDMLDLGGIPQGDYAPVPFVMSSGGW